MRRCHEITEHKNRSSDAMHGKHDSICGPVVNQFFVLAIVCSREVTTLCRMTFFLPDLLQLPLAPAKGRALQVLRSLHGISCGF